MTDATKHMPTDPNARALTIGGKSVGGAPPAPVVLYIRGNDVLNSAQRCIVKATVRSPSRPLSHA